MTRDYVLDRLSDAKPVSEYSVAEYVRYHGEGHFHVWEARLKGQTDPWMLKSPTHEDERRLLYRDLALARVGSLFRPPITPKTGLARVPNIIAEPTHCKAHEQ